MTSGKEAPHVLYRFYDVNDVLLYVGITSNPGRRWGQHQTDRPWWSDVVRVELEHFPDKASVLAAEREAIETESPRHNIVHAVKVIADTSAPDWPPCSVCGCDPVVWAIDTYAAAEHPLKVDAFMKEHGVDPKWPMMPVSVFMDIPQPPFWQTYCSQHEDQADYGFPVAGWRKTVSRIAHVLDQHPSLVTSGDSVKVAEQRTRSTRRLTTRFRWPEVAATPTTMCRLRTSGATSRSRRVLTT